MTGSTAQKTQRKAQVWILAPISGEKPRVLLLKRPESLEGLWQPVTGGVEPHESFAEGGRRELLEETGFAVREGELQDLNFQYSFEGRWGHAEESVFFVELAEELRPLLDPKEHTDFEWVSFEEALKRVAFASQKEALLKVGEALGRRRK